MFSSTLGSLAKTRLEADTESGNFSKILSAEPEMPRKPPHARQAANFLLSLLFFACGAATLAAQDGITPIQVMKLRTVTGVFPSPDGERIAFLRSQPRLPTEEAGPAHVHLFVVPASGGEETLLVGGAKQIGGVAWSPDGKLLTFLDKRDKDEHAQVYALPMEGGEPRKLFIAETGVKSYEWKPDGSAIAFIAEDKYEPPQEDLRKLGFKPIVVDEEGLHTSLHLWTKGQEQPRRLTSGQSVYALAWSPDGSKIAAAIAPRATVDDEYMFKRLRLVDPVSGEVTKLVDNPGKLEQFTWSPDSRSVAYISGADINDPHAGMLYAVNVETKEVTSLTEGLKGMVHHVHWGKPDSILACVSHGVHTTLQSINVETKQMKGWRERPSAFAFTTFEVSANGKAIVLPASRDTHPEEVFIAAGEDWKRLTDSNPWLTDVAFGKQTVEVITARDGLKIEGLLLWPLGFEEGRRYPLVIVAHGGPEAHWSNGWNTSYGRWGQLLSARGYFAWFPNYRASTGYGVEFAKADHGDLMGGEFNDHLDAIAEFAERGLIDKARVGIGGGSYGGYTAAWAATKHTDDFAASISFVPVTDVASKWFTSDIPYELYHVHYQEKWPHEQMDFLRERSPMTYASQCRTPLLLLGGTIDPRISFTQPFQLYRAVKWATKTPVRYVQYPGEPHGNRTNVYQYDYAVRTLQWLDHYLRPGDHRNAPPPAADLDYGPWLEWKKELDKKPDEEVKEGEAKE